MTERLELTATDVAERLDRAGNSMFTRIDNTVRDLGERFDVATDLLDKITTDVSGRMEGASQSFAQTLDSASTTILTNLGKASDAFSEGLGQTTLQISGQFEQQSGLLVDHIDRAARDLERTASGSTKKLEEAGGKFAKHLETANSFLANQLSTTAGAIDERLEGISMQLTGKLETAGSRISERLEDVSGVVQKSLDKFNTDMEHMLTSREDTLGGLVDTLGKRAHDVDTMMRNYMGQIEESLSSAERRSAEVGKFIAENTTQVAANLEKEIRKLEASSDTQISNAARVMREQHERAIAAMNQMMAETASGFQQTAQDMRVTAQQVVKDIESARNELKRAIFDLPDETRANADAMRKVVADQISALNALADVVKRQSSALDLSGPGIYMPSERGTGSGK